MGYLHSQGLKIFFIGTFKSLNTNSVSYFLEHQIQRNVFSRNIVKTEDIFSEKLNPISVCLNIIYLKRHFQSYKSIPDNEVIYRFLECIFQSAELNIETAILSLVISVIFNS